MTLFVYRKWVTIRGGEGFFAFKWSGARQYEAEFVGLFLFGIVPLYIRQVTNWR